MKKLLLIAATFITTFAFSQSEMYSKKMKQNLQLLDSAKSAQDFIDLSASFERVGDAEKTQWLPYYYAAYANYMTGWIDPKADKDKVGAKSTDLLAKAEALETNNSEIFCMKQMIAVQEMTVDAMNRWQTYGKEATAALENAKKADPTNPRPYMLDGQTVMNTPEAFGGGKANAKPLLQKAVDLFATFKPASELHPSWGKKTAEDLLAQCSK